MAYAKLKIKKRGTESGAKFLRILLRAQHFRSTESWRRPRAAKTLNRWAALHFAFNNTS